MKIFTSQSNGLDLARVSFPRLQSDELGDPVVRSLEGLSGGDLGSMPPREIIQRHLGTSLEISLDLVKQIAEKLPVMQPSCQFSICIPVAAHEEGAFIYRALSSFSSQTAPKTDWEIVLFLNHPSHDKDGVPISPDSSIEEVERFQKDHPEVQLAWFYKALEPENLTIGRIRRILHDVVSLRHLLRQDHDSDHFMLRTDADLTYVSPELVSGYIELFKDHPLCKGLAGVHGWDKEACKRNPVLYFGELLLKNLGGGESAGANMAVRMSAYASIGGFDVFRHLGEDSDLDSRLQADYRRLTADGSLITMDMHPGIVKAGGVCEVNSSSRRAEAAMRSGFASIQQWSIEETRFGTENSDIRKQSLTNSCVDGSVLEDPSIPARINNELTKTLQFFSKGNTEWLPFFIRKIENRLDLRIAVVEQAPEKGVETLLVVKNMEDLLQKLRRDLFPDENCIALLEEN